MHCKRCGSVLSGQSPCPCAMYTHAADASAGRPSMTELVQAPAACDDDSTGGGRDMVVGGLWCLGGILVTVLTYGAAASNPGGGRYVVAYGAILFGAIQVIRGALR